MSADDFEHGLTITIPARHQGVALAAIRQLREAHRDLGGTTRLTKNGDRFSLTARGSVDAVLATTSAMAAIGDSIKAADEKIRARLRDVLGASISEEARKSRFVDMMVDALHGMPPRGKA